MVKVWPEVEQLTCYGPHFCQMFLEFYKKRESCLALGLNPGPPACEASVLTTRPRLHHIRCMKSWELILLCLHSYGPDFCQKSNIHSFTSSTLGINWRARFWWFPKTLKFLHHLMFEEHDFSTFCAFWDSQ